MRITLLCLLKFILLYSILAYSCNEQQVKKIIITGKIKNIPSEKIYLTNAYYWDVLLDSAVIENDKFSFELDTSVYNEPFFATICIKNEENRIKSLLVFNYKRTTPKDTFASSGFMLSYGKTHLTGDYNDKLHRVSIKPNPENDLFFDLKTEQFASAKNFQHVKNTIQKNSSSYFLLQKLYENKSLYSATEIKNILALFDKKLLKSKTAIDLNHYSNYIITKGDALPNSQLTNFNGQKEFLFNDSANISMLIFWASWCGPCRMEIPQLKNIRKKYPPQILSMKSISLDENSKNWEKALKDENMPWQQLLVPYNNLVKIKAQFTVNAVPVIIFVDKNKKEIKRFNGYSENNIIEYNNFIKEYINKIKN